MVDGTGYILGEGQEGRGRKDCASYFDSPMKKYRLFIIIKCQHILLHKQTNVQVVIKLMIGNNTIEL